MGKPNQASESDRPASDERVAERRGDDRRGATAGEASNDAPGWVRSGVDRRQNHSKAFWMSLYMRRRKGERRKDETGEARYYVDLYSPWLLTVVILVLLLCCLDTFNTLTLLELGGEEVNPVMKKLLDDNIFMAFAYKYIVTSIGLIILVVHKHFTFLRMFKIHWLIWACLAGYCALIIWEFYLFHRISLGYQHL